MQNLNCVCTNFETNSLVMWLSQEVQLYQDLKVNEVKEQKVVYNTVLYCMQP